MATIRLLTSGKWNVQVRLAGYPTRSSTHETRQEAEAWAKEHESRVKEIPQTLPLLETPYLQEVMIVKGVKRGGYVSTKYRFRALANFFGNTPLPAIKGEDVARYKVERQKEVTGSTVRLELQLLSRVMRWASSEKGVECEDVVKKVKLPEAGKPRDKVITPDEYARLLDAISAAMKPVVILAWETAMRRSEILSITPRMINANTRTVHLTQTKNGEARDVPLSPMAVKILGEQLEHKRPEELLFPLEPHSVSTAFRRACLRAGVTGVCFHSLRHTCITRYAEKGLNTVQLQCISGHKDITMLARYSHIKASSVAQLMG